jgi:mannitol operon repressor
MEKPEPTVTLSPIELSHPHLAAFTEFLEEFNKETERGAALSATAFIDTCLSGH